MTDKELAQQMVDKSHEYNFFSWAVQSKARPMALAGGEGCYFWDVEGNGYLDFISQLMCINAGHQHPKIVAAIKEQADKLYFAAPKFTTQARAELAELLVEITPSNLTKVLFTLSGAESNENAIKFVRHYTGKFKIIARFRGYHGASYGAMSISGDGRRTKIEPGIPGVIHVFDPYCYRCSFNKQREKCSLECVFDLRRKGDVDEAERALTEALDLEKEEVRDSVRRLESANEVSRSDLKGEKVIYSRADTKLSSVIGIPT